MAQVVIVDYGLGNIKSVQRGLEHANSQSVLSADPDAIVSADRLVLPGVGAFKNGMDGLKQAGVIDAIVAFVNSGKPLLGICLGMQMLLDSSEEHGNHQGLGLIPGSVVPIPKAIDCEGGMRERKIPHIGWSALRHTTENNDWNNSILENQKEGEFFYFVHSYMAVPNSLNHLLAECDYEGLRIAAAIQKDNVTGLQFHPEKSGELGLKILELFVQL